MIGPHVDSCQTGWPTRYRCARKDIGVFQKLHSHAFWFCLKLHLIWTCTAIKPICKCDLQTAVPLATCCERSVLHDTTPANPTLEQQSFKLLCSRQLAVSEVFYLTLRQKSCTGAAIKALWTSIEAWTSTLSCRARLTEQILGGPGGQSDIQKGTSFAKAPSPGWLCG